MTPSPWPKVSWWKAGVVVATGLVLFAMVKGAGKSLIARGVPESLPGGAFWLGLFAVGFVMGAAYTLVRWIPGPLGRFGDALLGIALSPIYVGGCFLILGFPEIRGEPMDTNSILFLFGGTAVAGAVAGLVWGHDFRNPKTPPGGPAAG
ncbi:MAG: hypothetical protein WBD40_05195 [Tepidisphaeraceae bacterium]